MVECKAAAGVVLERLCGQHDVVMPRVSYDLRGRCAGVSYDGQRHISFNLRLFREHFFDFIESVVPHELAHVMHEDSKVGGRDHGKEWKAVMQRLGFRATVFHNYCTDFASSRTGLFRYSCVCGSRVVGLEMHRDIQARPWLYQCDKCQRRFIYLK